MSINCALGSALMCLFGLITIFYTIFDTRNRGSHYIYAHPESILSYVKSDVEKIKTRAVTRWPGALASTLLELNQWNEYLDRTLESEPDYVSKRLKFEIFGPEKTATMFTGAYARNLRRSALTRSLNTWGGPAEGSMPTGEGAPTAEGSPTLGEARTASVRLDRAEAELPLFAWGLKLARSTPEKVPSVERVAAIIENMRLPDSCLEGTHVLILPMALYETSGLAFRDTIVIGSRPADYESMEGQLDFTVAHEIGHVLADRYLDSKGWQDYMRLRRIEKWFPGGRALTRDWKYSVEEAWAEDIRALFGSTVSARSKVCTAYTDPREDKALAHRITHFATNVLSSPKSRTGLRGMDAMLMGIGSS